MNESKVSEGGLAKNDHLPIHFRGADGPRPRSQTLERPEQIGKSLNRARRNQLRANAYRLSGNVISSNDHFWLTIMPGAAGRAAKQDRRTFLKIDNFKSDCYV
jgi:hypothetical protein